MRRAFSRSTSTPSTPSPTSRLWQALCRSDAGLHAQIMAVLGRLAADRLTEEVERLAHHARRGEVWDKALHHGRQAGEKAMTRSAHQGSGDLL